MRKYLLMGILAVALSGMAYSAGTETYVNGNYAVDGKIDVTAEVVSKIDLTTENVEFGKVAVGTISPQPEKNGKITIKSNYVTANMKVKVTAGDKGFAELKDGQVYLNHENDVNPSKVMYTPEFYLLDTGELTHKNGEIDLTGKSTYEISVRGTLTVPEDAKLGDYKRTLGIRVTYDDEI